MRPRNLSDLLPWLVFLQSNPPILVFRHLRVSEMLEVRYICKLNQEWSYFFPRPHGLYLMTQVEAQGQACMGSKAICSWAQMQLPSWLSHFCDTSKVSARSLHLLYQMSWAHWLLTSGQHYLLRSYWQGLVDHQLPRQVNPSDWAWPDFQLFAPSCLQRCWAMTKSTVLGWLFG